MLIKMISEDINFDLKIYIKLPKNNFNCFSFSFIVQENFLRPTNLFLETLERSKFRVECTLYKKLTQIC